MARTSVVIVDGGNQIIKAAGVTQCAADSEQLIPMLDAAMKNTGETPGRVLADAGYKSEDNFTKLEDRNVDAYLSVGPSVLFTNKAATTLAQGGTGPKDTTLVVTADLDSGTNPLGSTELKCQLPQQRNKWRLISTLWRGLLAGEKTLLVTSVFVSPKSND